MQTAENKRIFDSKHLMPHVFEENTSKTACRPLAEQRTLYWLMVPAALIAMGALALSIDCPLAQWCVKGNCPAWLENLVSTMEPFGNGIGVGIMGITIFVLIRPGVGRCLGSFAALIPPDWRPTA